MRLHKPLRPGERFGAEHARPHYVVDDLADLTGPTSGRVTLPVYLDWWLAPTYDLEDPTRLSHMYETVILHATGTQDLCAYLDRETLTRLWSTLDLPPYIRMMWEMAHPRLHLTPLSC